MRHAPSPRIAAAIGLLFPLVFVGLVALSGVTYGDVSRTTSDVVRAVLIPEAILAVLLILLTSWLGWWGPVWKEKITTPRWMVAMPIVIFLTILGSINYAVVTQQEASYLLITAIATLFVGFSEELTYRGLAVVGLRGGVSEVKVWLFSATMFALLHAWNILLGQSASDTLKQVIFAFVLGSVLYAIRRATGGLLFPILLHAMWDWASFTASGEVPGDDTITGTTLLGALLSFLGLLIAVILFAVGSKSLFRKEPATDPEPT